MRQFANSVLKHVLKLAVNSALAPVVAGIALSAVIAGPASAGHVCNDYGDMSDALKSHYGERLVSSTAKEKDRRMEFWVSKKGTWSMVLVLPNGRACLRASGPHAFTEKLRAASLAIAAPEG